MKEFNDIFFLLAQATVIITVILALIRLKFSDEVQERRFICLVAALVLFQLINITSQVKAIADFILQR